MVYTVLTALKLRSPGHAPRFWWHTLRSLSQARKAPGNLSVGVDRLGDHYCTITTWENVGAMRGFAYRGAHKRAIRAFPRIATGYIHSYEGEPVSWDALMEIVTAKGRAYD